MKNLYHILFALFTCCALIGSSCQSNTQEKAATPEAKTEESTNTNEVDAAAIAKYQAAVKTEDIPVQNYAGIKQVVKMADMGTFFGESYGRLGALMGENIGGAPAGAYYTWDMENGQTEMMAAFPMATKANYEDADIEYISLGGKACVIDYMGSNEGSIAAHYGMDAYFKEKGLKMKSPVLEQYLVGEDSGKPVEEHHTRIIYFIEE